MSDVPVSASESRGRIEEAKKLAAIDAIEAAGARAVKFANEAFMAAEHRAKDFDDILAAEMAVEAQGLRFAAEMVMARVHRLRKGRE